MDDTTSETYVFSKHYSLDMRGNGDFTQQGDDISVIIAGNEKKEIKVTNGYDDGQIRIEVMLTRKPYHDRKKITVHILSVAVLPIILRGQDSDFWAGKHAPFMGYINDFEDHIGLNDSGQIVCKRIIKKKPLPKLSINLP
jgi:hypothetical protein